MGGPNDHPCALDIKYRLKWYLLGKYSSDILSHNVSTFDKANDRCFTEIEKENIKNISELMTEMLLSDFVEKSDFDEKSQNSDEVHLNVNFDTRIENTVEDDFELHDEKVHRSNFF